MAGDGVHVSAFVPPTESFRMFAGRTGRGVRVAVIDSGVNAAHPHIGGVAGGVTIGGPNCRGDYTDLLGHGTAVMAAIKEKAPDAEYFAVRVFHSSLRTNVDALARAIEWSIERGVHVINLSLGTANSQHADRFAPLIERAASHGVILVSARDAGGVPALPGSMPGVIGVNLDWDCPREAYRAVEAAGGIEWYASGYPRSAPGIPRERNLNGISFAVANFAGFVVRAMESLEDRTYTSLSATMADEAASHGLI